jgi:phage-related protein
MDKILEVYFFRTETGTEPVRQWLKGLPLPEKKIIGQDIQTVEYGWPLGMPLVRGLGDGLWEIRSRLPDRIARVIFFIYDNNMILLHGFIKKGQKTPKTDIELAKKRRKLFLSDI